MKKSNREVNVFNVSALDLFASALGAFILITMMLMPSYLKSAGAAAGGAAAPAGGATAAAAGGAAVGPAATDNLLVMRMEWSAAADVDLYVTTPDGAFSSGNRTIAGKPGRVVAAAGAGPSGGQEVWMAYSPTAGAYQVCFQLASPGSATLPVTVRGHLDRPGGPIDTDTVQLAAKGQRTCPLQFTIDQNYTFAQR